MILPNEAMVNYVFPNNFQVVWSLMIVIYPFITGLIAGAFAVSALYHVFKMKEFKPIANFSLIMAFCFGLFAGLPLLVHLGQPQRAFLIYLTPHLSSAMSVFGYVYGGYMVLLTIEIWLIYRSYFIHQVNRTKGPMWLVWYVLTLGVTTYNPDSARIDQKLSNILSGIGIPWAFFLHGYVGFIFGSVKAIPWWAAELMPVIFLTSAMVSGMAMILVVYIFLAWRRNEPYDYILIKKFSGFLWGIFLLDWALEILELFHVSYLRGYEWAEIKPLLAGPLFGSFVVGQILVFSVVPALLLGVVTVTRIDGRKMLYLASIGSIGLILQVLFMRFNVVIGGQLISKSGRGFVEFHWEFFGKEGILSALAILAAPFVVYYVISRFIPIMGDLVIPEESEDRPMGQPEA